MAQYSQTVRPHLTARRRGLAARRVRDIGPAGLWLAWLVAALSLAASLTGLLVGGVYTGAASTAEMLRGYDLVTAAVAAPSLAITARFAARGSVAARLFVASLLAYLTYTYAYYLFGTGFNDLFLLHVAVFATALAALVLTFATMDAASVAERFSDRTPVRAIAAILGVLAAALGGMWAILAMDNAMTGEVPAGSRLVETDAIVHLGMALDLSLLVPLYAVAAALLWRRAPWSYPLATVALVSGILHQISYIVAMPFQVAAGIPGAVSYDPGEPVIVLLYLTATALLLHGLRRPSEPRRQP